MQLRRWIPRSLYSAARTRYIKAYGTFRQQEQSGVIQRAQYAYGLLRAVDIAKYFGWNKTTVCEFGVASGSGLLNMIDLATRLTAEYGVRFRIVGFDTGVGLPEPAGYKDHPEIWSAGDYPMVSVEQLLQVIKGRAELRLGDVRDTVQPFLATLDPAAPLGFVAIDVDIYTSAKHSLMCLLGRPELYNPAVSIYFDDIGHFFANQWCGELAAIEEFNTENELRKIDHDQSRRHPQQQWFQGMYVCHILDHPSRNKPDPNRQRKLQAGGNMPPGVLD